MIFLLAHRGDIRTDILQNINIIDDIGSINTGHMYPSLSTGKLPHSNLFYS